MAQCPRCDAAFSDADSHCPSCGQGIALGSAETEVLPPDPQADTPTKLETGSKQNDTPITTTGGSARFVAGTVLAGRYRIVGLIGKGGMGEVYKAEDLELDQTVAIKFLPEELAKNQELLRRFRGEVRMARQVSHANVCRVFDIGETEGLYYLTMEYIDGDDLSMLLKRIGRFPSDRAVEVSRQICMGLAAIHKAGILHRDLKPANIIIDSNGEARITDFGIAGLEAEVQGFEARVGTPAYMSPEQADGKELTPRNDIYSLGLLLYEIFTGKQAFEGDSVQELRIKHVTTTPTNPSDIVAGIDPLVEKVINRCLEKDPKNRPHSALRVAMSLPGGDPLQVALEAGETPTPEMVAATPKRGGLTPRIAFVLTLMLMSGFVLLSVLHQYFKTYNIQPLEKSPEILAEQAKTITRNLGYTETAVDAKYGFDIDNSFLEYAEKDPSISDAASRLRAGQPYQISFIFRQSPGPLETWKNLQISETDPPLAAGMTSVKLDTRGRLIKFVAVPDQVREIGAESSGAVDWNKLFDAAGLDKAKFNSTDPQWLPPVFADEETAWDGTLADFQDIPIRIEAASLGGKPVYFEVIAPWDQPAGKRVVIDPTRRFGDGLFFVVLFVVLVSAVLLARHNIKTGRSDLKGGVKLTTFCFMSFCLMNLLLVDHVWSLSGEMNILGRVLGDGLFFTVLIGLLYVALEPFARRYWSELLISWNRLLAGDVRDPMIGRDILVGGSVGVWIALIIPYSAMFVSFYVFGKGDDVSASFFRNTISGWTGTLAQLLGGPIFPVLYGLIPLFLLVLFFVIFRNKIVCAILVFLLVFLNNGISAIGGHWVILVALFLANVIVVLLLIRLGLLAMSIAIFYQALSNSFALTFDTSSHLFPGSVIVFVVVFGLAIYGFYTSTAGKSVWGRRLLE